MSVSAKVAWHDVECGGYTADLSLWGKLARAEGGPVLDVGAGTGRVALRLAAAGHDVTALDRDGELLEELREPRGRRRDGGRDRARGRRRLRPPPPLRADRGADADGPAAARRGRPGRVPRERGGRAAARRPAWRSRSPTRWRPSTTGPLLPLPDLGERDGLRYVSQPVAVRESPGAVRIERVRQILAPGGHRSSEDDVIVLRTMDAAAARRRGRRPRPDGRGAARDPRHRRARRLHGGDAPWIGTLRVCALYPDLMNIYADRGNLLLLERRCEWRGIGFELTGAGLGEQVDPDAHDLFYLGGGQDRDQALCAQDLATVKRDALHAAAARGAVLFGVCGGFQLLGHGYEMGDERLPGIGLVDLETVREDGPRLIGNVAIESTRRAACWPASRTTAGGRSSARAPSRSARSSTATATTGAAATRASAAAPTAPWWARTSTGRCFPRTPGSPTG